MLVNAVFTIILWVTSSVIAYSVHKDMTVDELKRTFHVDSHHLVPEYEVISVHHVRKRTIKESPDLNRVEDPDTKVNKDKRKLIDRTHLRFNAFGKPVKLNLVRNEGLLKKGKLKIWTVEPNATAQHGLEYMEQPETDEDIGEIYQDEANQAAILLRNDKKSLIVEGSIGSDLVIRPIPRRLGPSLPTTIDSPTKQSIINSTSGDLMAEDDEEFLDEDGDLSSEVHIDTGLPIKMSKSKVHKATHVVFKRKPSEEDLMSDYALMEPDHLSKRYRRSTDFTKHSRKKREAPYTIYPEILVIVDYDGYRLHGGDNLQIKRYFVSFWNGVDLRYKLLKGPKVRISIAGIIISRGRDATPYLEHNRVGRDAIDSAAALTEMGKYLFRERRLPVYDIAVAITKLDMCRRSYPNDVCNRGTAGFAYVGGACVVNKRLEKVNSVAIIEDTGGFSGIIVAAHEVGHLLGAVHDGSPPPSYLGGPGAEKCQWTDGYIMSDLRHTERGFRWSTCSIQSFHHFLNGDTATCLYNAPHEDDSLPRVLPGKLLSLDAQCRRDRGTSACFKDDRVCAQLFCFDSASGYCVAYRPAAEGSACGDGQYCLNGRCVTEHENIIPDYSQNTPSYMRGNHQGRPLFYEEDVYQNTGPQQTYTPPQYPYQTLYQNDNPFYTQNFFSASSATTQRSPQTPTETTTTRKFFTISTTKSPYNFENFGSSRYYTAASSTVQEHASTSTANNNSNSSSKSTSSPFFTKFFHLKQTTKNPYDFADFGKSTGYNDNVNNNYLKRSYNAASYFSDSSNLGNVTVVDDKTRKNA